MWLLIGCMVQVISEGRFLRQPKTDGVVRVHDKKDKKVYKAFLAQEQEYNHEQVASQI